MTADADRARSASHVHSFEHLTEPFAGGALDAVLPLDDSGRASVAWASRHPLLLAGAKRALGAEGVSVTVAIAPSDGQATAPLTLRFEPFTEAGAFLPAFRPDPQQRELFAPFDVQVELIGAAPGMLARDVVELRLVEGVLGRLLYILGAEKQRLRRQARELFAVRQAAFASVDALDRLG